MRGRVVRHGGRVGRRGEEDLEGVEGVVTLTGQQQKLPGLQIADPVYELPYPLYTVANAKGEEAWVLRDTAGNTKLKLRFAVKGVKNEEPGVGGVPIIID